MYMCVCICVCVYVYMYICIWVASISTGAYVHMVTCAEEKNTGQQDEWFLALRVFQCVF